MSKSSRYHMSWASKTTFIHTYLKVSTILKINNMEHKKNLLYSLESIFPINQLQAKTTFLSFIQFDISAVYMHSFVSNKLNFTSKNHLSIAI